jgi:hypothetical protein
MNGFTFRFAFLKSDFDKKGVADRPRPSYIQILL